MRKITALLFLFFILTTALVAEQTSDAKVIASYEVTGSQISGLPDDHGKIWTRVRTLVASDLLRLVNRFELFEVEERPDQLQTDGFALLNEDLETFTLALSLKSAQLAFFDRKPEEVESFQKTIVHEQAHILSLQGTQFDRSDSPSGPLEIDEGVLKAGSYLNQFHARFWKKAFPGRGTETVSDADAAVLFKKLRASFVSEYAATGPVEDFAESFSAFVTEAKPKGSAIKNLKVKFFYDWPELVSMRTEIRKGLTP